MSETLSETASVVDKYRHRIEFGFGGVDVDDLRNGAIKLLQSRAELSPETIVDYASLMSGGKGRGNTPAEFPAVRVFYVPTEDALYLTAGHHRWHAAEQAGKPTLAAEFMTGTKQEAVVDSIASNAAHGLRPSSEDIRASLKLLLDHAKFRRATSRHLARIIGCSPTTVEKHRTALTDQMDSDADSTRIDKNGRTIKTKNIGTKKKSEAPAKRDEPKPAVADDADADKHDADTTDKDVDAPAMARRRFRLPDDPTEAELLTVESWLESQDERPAVERFQALWSVCTDADKMAIAELMKVTLSDDTVKEILRVIDHGIDLTKNAHAAEYSRKNTAGSFVRLRRLVEGLQPGSTKTPPIE